MRALIAVLLLLISVSQVVAVRPPSGHCPFEGVVESVRDTSDNEDTIRELRLLIRLNQIYTEGLCNSLVGIELMEVSWFTPESRLPSGRLYRPGQPEVDLDQLIAGAIVRGSVDSYDKIVSDLIILGRAHDMDADKNTVKRVHPIRAWWWRIENLFRSGVARFNIGVGQWWNRVDQEEKHELRVKVVDAFSGKMVTSGYVGVYSPTDQRVARSSLDNDGRVVFNLRGGEYGLRVEGSYQVRKKIDVQADMEVVLNALMTVGN